MATLLSTGGALDTNNLGITQFLAATSYSNSATQIFASFGGGRSQILLGSFVFDGSGALIGGTITGIVENIPGSGSYQIGGLNFPVADFLGFLNAGNRPGLISALFAGNDGFLGGGQNDTLNGGTGADTLSGLGGDDVLEGGTGSDQLIGGTGNDTYFVDTFGDQVLESSNEGNDTVIATANFGLGSFIENLTLAGTAILAQGNELANVITGNDQANTLLGMDGNDTLAGNDGDDGILGGIGNDLLLGGNGKDTLDGEAGNDTLDGGTGNDRMTGGDGDDTYTVDILSDIVIELSGKGTDMVIASISHSLANNIENLTLTGGAKIGGGNVLDNIITGNNLDNHLNASDGNDTIAGADGKDTLIGAQGNDLLLGGDGDDVLDGGPDHATMEGGKGDDAYVVGDLGDVTIEVVDGGIDTVVASISHQLASNIENLTLRGGALTGIGNELNNSVVGNIKDNQLDGGEGNDTVAGNDGNDTLIGAQGSDSLLGGNGSDYLSGDSTAGDGNDTLHGDAGNDTLDGGVGADSMVGGLGDDLYLVDDELDYVADEVDGGIDTVHSTAALFTLGAGIEILVLKDTAHTGIGNELDNIIVGSESGSSLNGADGNDTLSAGGGKDLIDGSTGNDVIDGGDNDDILRGSDGDDSVLGGTGDDELNGGAGTDTLEGGIGSDTLLGEDGDDILIGGAGADAMRGNGGNDIYYIDDVEDSVSESANDGTDTVHSTVSFSILGEIHIENVTLLGSADIDVIGNSSSNLLIGNSGNNSFDGIAGNDTMIGGGGNDAYVVAGGVEIIENANEGIDTVLAQASYKLAANIENLTVSADVYGITGEGNALNNVMTSNDVGAALYGLDGADTIIGGISADTLIGGAGIDSMTGGSRDDIYGVDNKSDLIAELADGGRDTVQSFSSYELGENLEDLVLLAGAATGKGNSSANLLQGNGGSNGLFGNAGNDTLNGGGGADTLDGGIDDDVLTGGEGDDVLDGGANADTMDGGLGNDHYFVDDESDDVAESEQGGTDTVFAQIDYQLAENLENLTAVAGYFITGEGNELNNVMTANEVGTALYGFGGADTIIGGLSADTLAGGAGADSMAGGGGDDFYDVDNKSDLVTELSGGGHDSVQSSIDHTLKANFEDLVLTGTANRGTGNNAANVITGNDGVNNLDGGSGNDTIYGGAGNDTLYGSFGNDLLFGGAGDDRIDCIYNQDRAMYTSVLDGHDLLTNFSTGGTGQDYVDLDGLFDSLGVAAADRADRVTIVDNGGGADVCIDTDGVGGWDLNLVSIQYVPDLSAIAVGTDTTCDVFVGS